MTRQAPVMHGISGLNIIGTEVLQLDGTQSCLTVDPDIFFPDSPAEARTKLIIAKEICRTCSQQAPCLEYALKHSELEGIWAGTNERDRRGIRRAQSRKQLR